MDKKTVLVVEDNQLNRAILRKILESEYEVLEACDGTVGLSVLEKKRAEISLVILDIWMPLLDGIGVLSSMRTKGWLTDMPVVVITSDATAELESRLHTFGVKFIISKPFNPKTVRDCVKDAIETKTRDSEGLHRVESADSGDARVSLLTRINTFVYEYDHKEGISHIDKRYKECLRGNWHLFELNAPEHIRSSVYRPDYEKLSAFLKQETTEGYDTLDVRLLTVTGGFDWFRIGKLKYVDERGAHTVLTFSNVSNEMRAKERLNFLARNDSLTQIPNLQAFFDNTRGMFVEHPEQSFVLIRIGIERFSVLNQIYGRAEGDKLLRYIAVKLQECVECDEYSTYCRVRGDDFAVCLVQDEQRTKEFMQDIRKAAALYPLNFEVELCFGIYEIEDTDMPVDDMLERASTAQKTIKGNYNTHVAVYNAELRRRDDTERMVQRDMHQALTERQFILFLQPKCDMRSGEIVGSEALVRWQHPEHGLIAPVEFIPIFERSGFIAELDHYMLVEACKEMRRILDSGATPLPISVNISRADLYNPHLVQDILQVTAKYGIPHELLGFELTESSFVFDNSMVDELTESLKENHFCVLMDDFGSGYSSLNTLKDIRVNTLKIDLRFLQSSRDIERANMILRSVCRMAQDIDLEVVVEGVETVEQVELLRSIGIRFAQGYYFYRPMPATEYTRLQGMITPEPAPRND